MAAVEINPVNLPHTAAGYNLTDSTDFAAVVNGAGNGVKFDWQPDLLVLLWAGAAGLTTFTVKMPATAGYTSYGCAVTDPTIAVAANKQVFLRLDEIFKNAAGQVTIEVDLAANGVILVLNP